MLADTSLRSDVAHQPVDAAGDRTSLSSCWSRFQTGSRSIAMDRPRKFILIIVGLALLASSWTDAASVTISASPSMLGVNGDTYEWVTVTFTKDASMAANTDWVGLFSPANFNGSVCMNDPQDDSPPFICTAPVKFQYANFSSMDYSSTGKGSLTFRLINRRQDYAFGFFSGDIVNPVLEAVSNTVTFHNPKAPVWPRLAVGKNVGEMTVTWTSGYSAQEARPIVAWRWEEDSEWQYSLAITRTYTQSDMCGAPASTVGWRDPGFVHTAFLKNLWASNKYYYKVGHKLANKHHTYVWGEENFFTSAPFPGENSLQRVVIFGDMGKKDRDGSLLYNDDQPGALAVTDALVKDLTQDGIDFIINNGDITYSDGYLAQWDQYTEQISNITKRVPWMLSAGNHERDWPNTGSFYKTTDSGGECGVPTATTFPMPTFNSDQFWYSADWGMFRFCVGASEMDWREGSDQYKFLEECFASVDRQRQPWLVFVTHRALAYSSGAEYQAIGTFAEPMGRESLQPLWQKYKVDLGLYGHVHSYERTCPVYQSRCVGDETQDFSGTFNGTIHIVAGTGGRAIEDFGILNATWSLVKHLNLGYVKLTSSDHQNLLVEFKHTDGSVGDSFSIRRRYPDVLGCDASLVPICPPTTSADL